MEKIRKERILILAKTYPSPSAQYVETSCVAGISQDGAMRRLFPVPFRMIEDGQQFRKWQWIDVRVEKAPKDHRPESHKIYVDTINCGDVIDTKKAWSGRWEWLEKIPAFDSYDAIEATRRADGLSLALLRPKRLIGLDIFKARNPDWTDEEREKLLQEQMQGNLFDEVEERRQVKQLRKVPFDFHYRYVYDTPEGEKERRHKIVDWEAGALFWKCRESHGTDWEKPFRAKLEEDLGAKDLMFLMGNQHRFQDQWLIISLVYPPRAFLI
ncbi:hypothetical protein [Verminephrobacter eiseniae]|uniref:Uncharacterized protein n=1 Tax=Verminephrobacter eiseniae (strain EF01-2) TaxID=391735 RepID=A1WE59_VEREI|nr:hypothetical protein [Verminephrobacter eiseniae]ABM55916.1 conserved hypothetical protein [Verminephrobacter eiseniae EF01-2]MCW5286294.1 hypothetical protein [Verminephrobacter eiseniae]MCW5304593.1 hypothetical protein [Verminephrobacter eiseniae]MCW8182298.1 hypothetical protein [Verminephrobacter eiseniae]MCW8192419.1 hypothetical protein [Verminephrobacter eiseniae]